MMELIRGQVLYLDPVHIERYTNLALISNVGDKLLVNPLIFSVFSSVFLDSVFETSDFEDVKIITDFSFEELKILVDFCTLGLLPAPLKDLLEHDIPRQVLSVFSAFGVNLQEILKHGITQKTISCTKKIKKESIEEILFEPLDVKLEVQENKFLDYDEDFVDENDKDFEFPVKKQLQNKQKRKKKRKKANSDSSEEDFNDNDTDDDQDWEQEKTKATIATKNSSRSTLQRKRQEIQNQYENFISVQVISSQKNKRKRVKTSDWDKYTHYVLSKPLSEYVQGPQKMSTKMVGIATNLTQNSADESSNNSYKCSVCQVRFLCPRWLESHVNKHHYKHYQCDLCRKVFSIEDTEGFKKHHFKHSLNNFGTKKDYQCIQCGFENNLSSAIIRHVERQGTFHDNQCTQCTERFKSYQDYQIHITEEHEGKCTFKCGQCEEIFAIKDDLLLHRFQVHKILSRGFKGHQNLQVKDRICEICGKVIKGNLSQHVRTIHEGFDEQVSCDTCGKVFKSKSHLGAHIRTSHKKLPCEICGIMIPVGLKARHYQQAHVKKEDRKFKCEICGKGFALSHNLKDHMNTHTGARPYVCKFCGKDFASAGNHRMHEKSHMGFKRNGK